MTRTTHWRKGLLGATGMLLCYPLPAFAQAEQEVDARQAEIDQLKALVNDLTAHDAVQREKMQVLEARLAAVEMREKLLSDPLSLDDAAEMRGAYVAPEPVMMSDDPGLSYFRQNDARKGGAPLAASTASYATPSQDEDPDRKAPAPTDAVVEVQEQQQGRFGSRLGLELGLSYSHFDNARVNLNGFLALDAIFLGTISIDQISSDIVTFDPTLRFGVSDRLFFDANLPYLYRTTNFRSGGAGGSASALIEETVRDSGLGDLSVGASYRLVAESNSWPDLVLNARMKFPTGRHPFGIEFVEVDNSEGNLQVPMHLATGNGVYGGSIGLSALKTLDPLVVYGSATYFHNFARNFADIDEKEGDIPGRVDIGDAYQFGAGLAFALNDKSSISMSYTQRFVGHTRLHPDGMDERIVVGSQANVSLVNLGATFSLGRRLALVANVGMGMTDDSPDMTVSVRLPYRF